VQILRWKIAVGVGQALSLGANEKEVVWPGDVLNGLLESVVRRVGEVFR
jgi:hypothetical protein